MFTLHSKYSPTGDQPQAIEMLSNNLKKGVKHQTLWGVTGSGKTFTMANIINNVQKPTLIIAHNKTLAAQLADEFREFFPENAVHYFVSYYDYYQPEAYIPHTDTYIEKDSSINDEIDRLRHAATHALLTRKDVIIVASVSCIYGIGSPEFYKDTTVFEVGQKYNRNDFLHHLNNLQYQRNDTEVKRGTYSLKGDLLEIFPAYSNNSFRIEFFGDEVERITEVDWITGQRIKDYRVFEVYPAKHFISPAEVQKKAMVQIKIDLDKRLAELKSQSRLLEAQRLEQRTNFDLEMIEQTGYCSGIENYSRYFDGRAPGETPITLMNYFPDDFLLVVDESHITVPQVGAMFGGDFSRKTKLVEYGFRLPSAYDNRPMKFDEFYNRINQVVFTSATPAEFELKKSSTENVILGKAKNPKNSKSLLGDPSTKPQDDDSNALPANYDAIVKQFIRPTGLLDPVVEIRKTKGQIDDLMLEIQKTVKKGQRVLVTTLTKKMAEALTDFLTDHDIKVAYIHSDVQTFERTEILHSLRLGEFDVLVGINLLREGLDLPEVSLIAILDADKEGFLRSKTSLMQTMGRAARHVEGHVVMYADVITKSMKAAIDETIERRKFQEAYNKEHGITPRSVVRTLKPKEIKEEKEMEDMEISFTKLTKQEKKKVISDLNMHMHEAATKLEFEHAARIRDQIAKFEGMIR